MDLRHLRYFLAVAEEMHFGRAARRLGISQPPLSHQIRMLEDELGVRLFERTSRRVRLTDAGRLFLPEAQRTLTQAERAVDVARLAHRGELGRLSLGFTTSGPFVPRIASGLYAFRQSHPQVELELQELARDAQIALLEEGRLDIGIVRTFEQPALPPGVNAEFLLEEDMVLAMHQDHPLARRQEDPAIADLAGVPLVLYGSASGAGFNEHFFSQCKEAGFEPTIALEVSSFATLMGLAAAGFGATILSQTLARVHVENLVTRRMAMAVKSRLWLIYRDDLSSAARAFKNSVLMPETAPSATAPAA